MTVYVLMIWKKGDVGGIWGVYHRDVDALRTARELVADKVADDYYVYRKVVQ